MANNIFNSSGNFTIPSDITVDSLTFTNALAKGYTPTTNDSGKLEFHTPQTISTISFLEGVNRNEVELGHAWLLSNQKDESAILQSLINDDAGELTRLGLNLNNCRICIDVECQKGYLFINERITIPRNVSLNFKCIVAMGYNGSFYMGGLASMIPPNKDNSPFVVGNYPIGSTVFVINRNGQNMSTWVANDLVRFRNDELEAGSDNVIQSIVNNGNNTYTVTMRYPTEDFDIIDGDGIRKYSASILGATALRGDAFVTVQNGGTFNVGDIVSIVDSRGAGDIVGSGTPDMINALTGRRWWYSGNRCRYDTRTIVKKDGNKLYIESPLTYDYDSAPSAYVTTQKPTENSHISNLTAFWVEDGVLPRNNRHLIHLNTAYNCTIKNVSYSDCFQAVAREVQYAHINSIVRVDKSYMCTIDGVWVNKTSERWSSSSIGYGLAVYLNSFCTFTNICLNTMRHNITLSGTNNCIFRNITLRNTLGTSLDLHGCGEDDNIFENVYIDAKSIQETLNTANTSNDGVRKCLIQLGNPTHPAGSSYNKFTNCMLKWGSPVESNVGNVFGIDVIGKSIGNVFKDITIENVDIPISLYEYARGRLLSNIDVRDTIYEGIVIKNCNRICDISGSRQYMNAFSYQAGTMLSYNSNSFVIEPSNITGSMASFHNVFNGWVVTINTSNYTVSNYNGSNYTVTLHSNIAPALTSNATYTMQDSFVTTVRPIDGVYFNNCTFLNTERGMSITNVKNVRITDCYHVRTTTSNFPYAIDISGVSNGDVLMNNITDVDNFIRIANSSNLRIVANKILNQVSSNVLTDVGACSNITFNDNSTFGFRATSVASGTTLYNRGIESYGWSNNPANPALFINTSNGGIGIGTSNVNAPLQLASVTGNRRIVLNETGGQSNDHQFWGLGINSGVFRYQAGSSSGAHVWFAAQNSNSSKELLRVSACNFVNVMGSAMSNAVLNLAEGTASKPFITFDSSNIIATGSNINTSPLGAYYGRVLVHVRGVGDKWVALYD